MRQAIVKTVRENLRLRKFRSLLISLSNTVQLSIYSYLNLQTKEKASEHFRMSTHST